MDSTAAQAPTEMKVLINLLEDRILVRRMIVPRSDGLIIIKTDERSIDVVNDGTGDHGNYSRRSLIGTILKVGPGKRNEKGKFKPTTVKPGQVIVFSDWNDWEGAPEGLYLIREADIWGHHSA